MTTAKYRAPARQMHVITLEWPDENDEVVHSETFRLTPSVPAEVLLELEEMRGTLNPEDREGAIKVFRAMLDFADSVFVPPDNDKFAAQMRSREYPVDMPMLGWVLEKIGELYGDRPTVPSEPSSDGQKTIGTSSTESALSEGSILDVSLSTDSSTPSTPT
jgi:hypothetical protein